MQIEYARQPAVHELQEHDAGTSASSAGAVWPHSVNVVLGGWLIASALTFGHGDSESFASGLARIGEERNLPAPALRSQLVMWSDLVSGFLIVIFAGLSLSARQTSVVFKTSEVSRPDISRPWAPWVVTGVGLWLLFAPLVLWAPAAADYANDTLVGALVIAFAIIIPGVPGMASSPGPDVPPGWNYNPSSPLQRAPVVAFAFVGFFIARYLAAYQLGHLPRVWDPFFPDGTRRVLDSDISLAWPISDAGLGAISYLLEALTGFLGDTRRWRTMPWMVILFGILVVPLGVVSIVLIILQPLAVGAWCALCLATAILMLLMISPALDEVIATCQFLAQSRREGRPFWRTFWTGGTLHSHAEPRSVRHGSVRQELASAAGLTSIPWNLVVSAALGVWLMFAPSVLRSEGAAANSDHLIGALVVTFAVIAFGEVARAARFINLLLGAWLIVGPWLLGGGTAAAAWNDLAVGIALLFLSLPRGRVTEHFGSWDRYVV